MARTLEVSGFPFHSLYRFAINHNALKASQLTAPQGFTWPQQRPNYGDLPYCVIADAAEVGRKSKEKMYARLQLINLFSRLD